MNRKSKRRIFYTCGWGGRGGGLEVDVSPQGSASWGITYCKIGNFRESFLFRETSNMQSFLKLKSSRNGEIILSFIDIG